MNKIEEAFRGLGRTEKAKFISQNIDYANADAVAKYISAYLFDILEDVGNNEYVGNNEEIDFGDVTWSEERMYPTDVEYAKVKSPWISVKERLPEDKENVIIMCEHGAIFNGTYLGTDWFCMDGYIHDTFRGNPIYSSMVIIPPLWKPIAWMSIPSFDEILEANKDVLERIKQKGD